MSKNFAVSELHGKVFEYDKIKYIPSRNSYLDHVKYDKVNEEIKKGIPLLFMPNSLHEMNLQPKKYEKALYKIVLFGVLTDGREAKVVISGIRPSFEVVVDSQDTAIQLNQRLSQLKYGCPTNFELVRGKQFKGYRKDKSLFVKFYFRKLNDRREALKFIKSQNYETTADDMSSYHRVVCRDYMVSFSSWVEISDYKVREYTNIRGPVYDVNIKNYKTCELDITTNPQLAKDNIMSCCWDIETYSPDGQLPRPENPDHKMFMIGLTFQWHHSNNQLLRVCLVEHPCAPKDNYLTIVCGTEKKLIKAFGKIVYKMRPDIYLGFNDADYDWPWLIIRAKAYTGTLAFLANCFDRTKHWKNYDDEDVFKYNFKTEKVKLEADTYADGQTLQFPGYLNIDVRTMFRQLYPTAEKSNLNFYLKLNKLKSKNDMPYQELFRIYRELSTIMERRNAIQKITDKHDGLRSCFDIIAGYLDHTEYTKYINKMADVADYCVVDSQRCHELMKIRSVLMDRREIANLSYTSVFDALYRANGMKVRNIVIARGQKRGIKFSNITNGGIMEEGKYPGAYVFPPIKGLVSSKLTIYERYVLANERNCDIYKAWCDVTVDDMKLYTTIIELYSPYPSEEELCEIHNKYNIKHCFEEFLKENLGRPVTGLDFSSLYPSLIMAYNLSPEYIITNKKEAQEAHKDGHDLYKIKFQYNGRTVRGWSIRHDNKLDPDSPDCKFGIYPMILKELFDTRKLMKKKLHVYENQKELMDALPREEFDMPANKEKYEDICFNFNYINSKQKALKVFMNTFYGETGNKRSPFFVLQVAGAITTAGQNNIKMVQQYVEQSNCKVYYGDTDSLYITMPKVHFREMDILYYTQKITKEKYWSDMVVKTFEVIKILNIKVNTMLIEDNGTEFLKMAFEESLFPCAFLSKKMYYGIPHISIPNFNPKELFIRGLAVKKRGVSDILKKIYMGIVWDSVSLENQLTLMNLVKNKIDYIYEAEWKFDDFIKTDVFRPNKQNVKIQTFAKRMYDEGIVVKPHERFQYVIVKKNPYKYDHRGRKQDLLVGEKMEYVDRAKNKNMTIDLDYYVKQTVVGQFARLITYDPLFHVEAESDSIEDIRTADEKIFRNANKYVTNYCNKYFTTYQSKGKIYQKIFRMANKAIIDKAKEVYGTDTTDILQSNYDIDDIEKWLEEKSEKKVIKEIGGSGKKYVTRALNKLDEKDRPKKIRQLQDVYFARKNNSLSIMREKAFRERQALLQRQVRDNIGSITDVLNYQTQIVNNVSNHLKHVLDIDNKYNDANDEIPSFDEISDAKFNEYDISKKAHCEFESLTNNENMIIALNKLRYIYLNMVSNYHFIHTTRSIVDYLKILRNRNMGFQAKPKSFDPKAFIKQNVDAIVGEMMSDTFASTSRIPN